MPVDGNETKDSVVGIASASQGRLRRKTLGLNVTPEFFREFSIAAIETDMSKGEFLEHIFRQWKDSQPMHISDGSD